MKKKKKKQRILFEMTLQKAVDNVPVRQIEGLHVELLGEEGGCWRPWVKRWERTCHFYEYLKAWLWIELSGRAKLTKMTLSRWVSKCWRWAGLQLYHYLVQGWDCIECIYVRESFSFLRAHSGRQIRVLMFLFTIFCRFCCLSFLGFLLSEDI